MEIIDKLKKLEHLEEYRDQYLSVTESFKLEEVRMKRTNNSTTEYLLEHFNYEKRLEIIKALVSAGCPAAHVQKIQGVHETIYNKYQDNFEKHEGKVAAFDFYNLVNQATRIMDINPEVHNEDKINIFLKLKKIIK